MRETKTEGSTLLELLIVIGMIAILGAIALPSFLQQKQKAHIAEVLMRLEVAAADIVDYSAKTGQFPPDVNADVRPIGVEPEHWPSDIPGIDYDNWGVNNGRCLVQIRWAGLNKRWESDVYRVGLNGDDKKVAIALYQCGRSPSSIR